MAINDVNIHPGMRVVDAGGEDIGTIDDIYPTVASTGSAGQTQEVEVVDDAPSYGPSSPEGYTEAAPGEMTGDASSAAMPNYFGVEPEPDSIRTLSTNMVMHVGGDLYIPFAEVTQVMPDDQVMLGITAAEAKRLYNEKPETVTTS